MDLHLFAGADRGRIKDSWTAVLNRVQKTYADGLEIRKIYAGEDDLDAVLSDLSNGALFSTYTFALVYNAQALGVKELKSLQNFVKQKVDALTLVILLEETKTDKFSFVPKDRVKVFYELSDTEKVSAIQQCLKQHDYSIATDALELFCELVSPDTLDIKNQCDVLMSSVENTKSISLDEVETLIYHSREENVYTLCEFLFHKDQSAALSCLHKILNSAESEAVGIILGLQWQFRALFELANSGIKNPQYDDFKQRRIFSKKSQAAFQKALQVYSQAQIENALASINAYDQWVREFRGGSHRVLLELLVYEITNYRTMPLAQKDYAIFAVN